MRQFILPILIFYFLSPVRAQIPEQPTNLQSPNIATLGLYGEIPVSHFTGTPSIEIPLYKIAEKSIEIPLSLSYHSAGIRPDQHPGWTGLGWSLRAGGAIYRVVNSLPDEYNNPQLQGDKAGFYFKHEILSNSDWNQRTYLRKIAQDPNMVKDTEPDEFSFNFLGYSGKFYLDHLGNWQVQSDKPLKVIFNNQFLDIPFDKKGTRAQITVTHQHSQDLGYMEKMVQRIYLVGIFLL